MKSKKKQDILSVLFLLVLFFVGNYYLGNLINNKVKHEIDSYTLTKVDILRTSGYWNLSPFVIDDSATGVGAHNWTWAKTQPWCSGSGTFEEPYFIENITIDGGNSGNCITIKNSDKYFRIENCTFFNSGAGASNAGIFLDHVGNGTLINNNCSFDNENGIMLNYSDSTTVSGNTANNNSYSGIYLNYSNNTAVSGNTANNGNIGISILDSDNTTVSGNTAYNNSNGIYIFDSDNTTVSGNTINNSNYAISIRYSDNTTISGNTAINNILGIILDNSDNTAVSGNIANNNSYGIMLGYSNNTAVSGNTVNNNSDIGIFLLLSNSTTVSGNIVDNNVNYGIIIESGYYNLIYNNNINDNIINAYDNGTANDWDNGIIGNYWNDYAGVDANDDGIGDTPYIIPGTAGSQDNFPIWTDGDDIAPVISIIFPLPDSVFGLDAPNYNISIDELNLDTIWYTLDGGITNYTITSLTGKFNQLTWGALSEGNLTIRFYANDTAGNIGFTDIEVIIEIPEDVDGLPIISFGNYYILFTFITILSFVILEKRKKK